MKIDKEDVVVGNIIEGIDGEVRTIRKERTKLNKLVVD